MHEHAYVDILRYVNEKVTDDGLAAILDSGLCERLASLGDGGRPFQEYPRQMRPLR